MLYSIILAIYSDSRRHAVCYNCISEMRTNRADFSFKLHNDSIADSKKNLLDFSSTAALVCHCSVVNFNFSETDGKQKKFNRQN